MMDVLTVPRIHPLDVVSMRVTTDRLSSLAKPPGSLGRLESLAIRLAGISGQPCPRYPSKLIVVCAADHGVSAAGVSAYPRAVTAQMLALLERGGAAVCVLARSVGAAVRVVDMGVHRADEAAPPPPATWLGNGTRDLAHGPAMDRAVAERAIAIGMSLAADCDLVCTGDLGIANTTSGAAVVAAMTGADVDSITGTGTGIDASRRRHKRAVIARGLARGIGPEDPVGVLASVGGFEIGALCGLVVGAAVRRIPVVLDGLASGAAALLAQALAPGAIEFCIAGHVSAEPAHRRALRALALTPLLDLDLRLGEGTGAALALPLVDSATRILREMATLDEAGVASR